MQTLLNQTLKIKIHVIKALHITHDLVTIPMGCIHYFYQMKYFLLQCVLEWVIIITPSSICQRIIRKHIKFKCLSIFFFFSTYSTSHILKVMPLALVIRLHFRKELKLIAMPQSQKE